MGVKAIHNHIVFQFEDAGTRKTSHNQTRDQFSHLTNWGFEFSDFDESLNLARWVTVVAVGKDVDSQIQAGDRILVDALKWTDGVSDGEGTTYWRTNDEHVLALDPENCSAVA